MNNKELQSAENDVVIPFSTVFNKRERKIFDDRCQTENSTVDWRDMFRNTMETRVNRDFIYKFICVK